MTHSNLLELGSANKPRACLAFASSSAFFSSAHFVLSKAGEFLLCFLKDLRFLMLYSYEMLPHQDFLLYQE